MISVSVYYKSCKRTEFVFQLHSHFEISLLQITVAHVAEKNSVNVVWYRKDTNRWCYQRCKKNVYNFLKRWTANASLFFTVVLQLTSATLYYKVWLSARVLTANNRQLMINISSAYMHTFWHIVCRYRVLSNSFYLSRKHRLYSVFEAHSEYFQNHYLCHNSIHIYNISLKCGRCFGITKKQ